MNDNRYINEVSIDDLAQFDEVFMNAESEDEFETVPDGKYQVNVERVELTRTKSQGYPMLKWELRILPDDVQIRKLFRNNVIATNDNIQWLKKDLYKCSVEINKISELPANLDRLLDVKIEVTKRTRGENENVYINKRIEPLPDSTDSGPSISEDDIPF